ncbi:hypothetical protein CYY_004747 [Polysphondylium violaceum]|uniref:FNIP repeat-containing protein n=1 Tax=Polysphondylium violaceum TaxID=133409 RepID=A0A8J4PUT6_9MYCE|nr:hypothetical protein CYY_004747 [Polysphondylium violaceum]
MNNLFFSLWRNIYLKQKVFLSYTDYVIINNITKLDKHYNHLLSLQQNNIPVVYHLNDLDHYFLYSSHRYKYIITHVIVSTYFYVNYINLLQKDNAPIIFGVTITDKDKDPILLACDLPRLIKYYKYTNGDLINKDYIPKSVTSVYLEFTSIDVGVLPNRVKTLVLENQKRDLQKKFNTKCLPPSLTQFRFHDREKKLSINLDKFPNLLYLNINSYKNVIKGNGSIKYLLLAIGSKKVLKNKIPITVTQLKVKSLIPLNKFKLPQNLIHLSYQMLNEKERIALPSLPSSLETLILKCCLSSYPKDFPPALANYTYTHHNYDETILFIPPKIKKLKAKFHYKLIEVPIIPPTVTDFKMAYPHYDFIKPMKLDHLTNITKLTLRYNGDLFIGIIPPTVKDLYLLHTTPIEKGVIPNSVTKLSLKCQYSVSVYIPNSVSTLKVNRETDMRYMKIPTSVKVLKGNLNERFLFDSFPNITTFCFGEKDDIPLFEKILEIKFPYYNINRISSNTRLVTIGGRYQNRSKYHFIDGKVYKENYNKIPKNINKF